MRFKGHGFIYQMRLPWPYELSHVKNEFSLVGLTACQYENAVEHSILKKERSIFLMYQRPLKVTYHRL